MVYCTQITFFHKKIMLIQIHTQFFHRDLVITSINLTKSIEQSLKPNKNPIQL